MFARRLALQTAFAVGLFSAPLAASEQSDTLFEAMRLPDLVEVMREEGLAYAAELEQSLFVGSPGQIWTKQVQDIYDIDRMEEVLRTEFASALDEADLGPMIAFFTSELGRNVTALELSAREALLDEEVETAAQETAAIALADETDRAALVERFIEVNELIETNVVGAMNSNYAFYMGLFAGGALEGMAEDELLSDVWEQEMTIRQNTTEWIYGYLLLAYGPLSDDEIETYIGFSGTEAGKILNRSLFEAFDVLFVDISLALGTAAAVPMAQQEL